MLDKTLHGDILNISMQGVFLCVPEGLLGNLGHGGGATVGRASVVRAAGSDQGHHHNSQ